MGNNVPTEDDGEGMTIPVCTEGMYIYAFYDINKNPPANIIQINRIVPYAHLFDGASL